VTTAAITEFADNSAEDDSGFVLLKVEEAARRVRIGRTTCFNLIRAGVLESVPVGHLRRVPVEAVNEYVARLREANRSS
jgi:excisionase family DNA binding protein